MARMQQSLEDPEGPYSVFTPSHKACIIILVTVAAWFSTLSSFIYFPAIDSLAKSLNVTVQQIHITVTAYMIASAIAPVIVGDMADRIGRRPTYLTTMSIYVLANVGLALQREFSTLISLRALQSVGISGTFSIAYGVLSDIARPQERGAYAGLISFGTNTAPSVGPILGGLLNEKLGWQWIFWFLAIASGLCLIGITFFLPETARSVVGNGSVRPPWINRLPLAMGSSKQWQSATLGPKRHGRSECHFPNPFAFSAVLMQKSNAAVICSVGILYMASSCIQVSLSSLFISVYRVTSLQAGLVYLPFGIASSIGAIVAGKIIDFDYRAASRYRGLSGASPRNNNPSDFPIEQVRLKRSVALLPIIACAIAGYGWALQARTYMAIPLVFQFFCGLGIQGCFTALNILLVDLNPQRPSLAQASCNVVRCGLAAGGVAALQPMIDKLGVGWYFTLLSIICSFCGLLFLILWRNGVDSEYVKVDSEAEAEELEELTRDWESD